MPSRAQHHRGPRLRAGRRHPLVARPATVGAVAASRPRPGWSRGKSSWSPTAPAHLSSPRNGGPSEALLLPGTGAVALHVADETAEVPAGGWRRRPSTRTWNQAWTGCVSSRQRRARRSSPPTSEACPTWVHAEDARDATVEAGDRQLEWCHRGGHSIRPAWFGRVLHGSDVAFCGRKHPPRTTPDP